MPEDLVQKNVIRNRDYIVAQFGDNADLIVRDFTVGRHPACIIGIVGLVDKMELSVSVLDPLLQYRGSISEQTILNTLSAIDITTSDSLTAAALKVSKRNSVLFVDGIKTAFIIDASASLQRTISEPKNETVVRGPHVGFIENLTTNLALVRRYVNNPKLRVEIYPVGSQTKVDSALVYLEGVADERIVSAARSRLTGIDTDGSLGCGFIEQYIEDAPHSIFPTIRHTERPDTLSANLLEGRIGILSDGCGTALIVPHLFMDGFHITEDYHSRPYYSSFMRLIRFIGFLVSSQLPSMYIGIENFHKELVPSKLLVSLAGAREGVPFPLGLEIVLMLTAFELIKESGIRMPQPIGASVSIVAGLILGESAVDSGFVSITTIIIVAVAGLSSFLTTNIVEPSVLLRFLLIIPTSFVGLYGLLLADLVIAMHLVGLKSFGVPYLAPIAPAYFRDWKDSLIRVRLKHLRTNDDRMRHNIAKYLE